MRLLSPTRCAWILTAHKVDNVIIRRRTEAGLGPLVSGGRGFDVVASDEGRDGVPESARPGGVVIDARFFEAVCQGNPDLIIIVDGTGTIVFANERCRDLLGYNPAELVGQRVEMLVPDRYAHHAVWRAAYQVEPTTRPMGTRSVLNARHKSGAEVPLTRSAARRLMEQSGLYLNDHPLVSPDEVVNVEDGAILRLSRKQYRRIQRG